MTTEQKIYVFGGLATVLLIIGGAFFATKRDKQVSTPLIGQPVSVSQGHVPDGTHIPYTSNPPAGGEHYAETAHAGVYNKAPADGLLVHSLEHGAVILWYNPKLLSSMGIEQLKTLFSQIGGKSILTPRLSMSVPIALSSWGRILKLKNIDEKQIKAFFDTNEGRGPEQAPI